MEKLAQQLTAKTEIQDNKISTRESECMETLHQVEGMQEVCKQVCKYTNQHNN